MFIVIVSDKTCSVILLNHWLIFFFTSSNFFYFKHLQKFGLSAIFSLIKLKKSCYKKIFKIIIQNIYSKKWRDFRQNIKLSNNEIQLLKQWKLNVYHFYINFNFETIIRAFKHHQQESHNWIPHATFVWTTRQISPFGLKMKAQGNIILKNRCWLGWPRRSGSPSEVRRFRIDGSNFSL